MKSINPKNNQLIQEHTAMTSGEVQETIDQVHSAWLDWKEVPFAERARLFKNLAKELLLTKEQSARLITDEMGKVLPESMAEIEKCAKVCEYYAAHAEEHLAPQFIETEARVSKLSYQPMGIVFGIMPWNFPYWQVFRYAVPTLMSGNATILKHAPNVFLCANDMEGLFRRAGFPDHVFRSLIIDTQEASRIIEHQYVHAVTLTGSTRAGKAVAAQAGKMLKKTVLELGGSDPYLILKVADLESAVNTCVKSRLLNVGQSCISAKRFIVVEEVYEAFTDLFIKEMRSKTFGDPLTDVNLGPIARMDLRDQLHQQVQESISKGAVCEVGGEIPDMEGSYYPPTVLTNVTPGMPAFDEELFGPVAAVIRAKDEEEAIALANQSIYGLGAAVFTTDLKRGEQIAETRLNAGCCFVNELVHSDPRLPFGGIKESGYGRELGPLGIREFMNAKTVFVR